MMARSMTTARLGFVSARIVAGQLRGASRSLASGAEKDAEVVFDVTEDSFKEKVLQASKPVIIQAHASWCQPCQMLKPRMDAAVRKHNGDVLMARVDVDAAPGLAQALRVTGVPAVFGVVGGKMIERFTGLQPQAAVEEFVARIKAAGSEQST